MDSRLRAREWLLAVDVSVSHNKLTRLTTPCTCKTTLISTNSSLYQANSKCLVKYIDIEIDLDQYLVHMVVLELS